jgi:hypothetical protein
MSLLLLILLVWVVGLPVLAVGFCLLATRRRAPRAAIPELSAFEFDAHAGRIRTPPRHAVGRNAHARARSRASRLL